MASTWSTSLRLELMADGDQANTWGATTNVNLGTLLESAIAGVASVTIPTDANYTMTAVNGTDDEARHMILEVASSGSLTATRDLVCPTAQKMYFVTNSTTGSQSIRVKTSAGTGITIANGASQGVYCDGTNVVNLLNNMPSGSTVGDIEIVTLTGAQTLTDKTLTAPTMTDPTMTDPVMTLPQINDFSSDHQYIFGVSELVADRTVTLPLLTGNDIFTFNDFAATLTNKTISFTNNTLSGTLAELNTGITDADVASLTGAETLTNKTLTSPIVTDRILATGGGGDSVDLATANEIRLKIASGTKLKILSTGFGGVTGSVVDVIRDEDDMITDDVMALATQQSIKAYADSVGALQGSLSGAAFTGAVSFAGGVYAPETTLVDGANISWDARAKQTTKVTLTQNATLDNPTNMDAGATYTLRVIQDAGGTNTLIYGTAYLWPGGTAPTLTVTGDAIDIITFVSDGTNMYGSFLGDFS